MAEIIELFVTAKGGPSVGIPYVEEKITILFHNRKEGETVEEKIKAICSLFSELFDGNCCLYKDELKTRQVELIEDTKPFQNEDENPDNIKVYVEGGTHLGIKGCYGVRTFQFPKSVVNLPLAISEVIRKENKDLKYAIMRTYTQNGCNTVYCFTGSNKETLFEFRIIKVEN